MAWGKWRSPRLNPGLTSPFPSIKTIRAILVLNRKQNYQTYQTYQNYQNQR
jgi:hypothetical protein